MSGDPAAATAIRPIRWRSRAPQTPQGDGDSGGFHGKALPVLNSHDIVSCGNPTFPKPTGSPGLPLTLELLPLEALSRETWLRKPPRS